MRQSLQTFEDATVEHIFACNLLKAAIYEDLVGDKNTKEYKDLYAMQPDEVHAHGLQEFAEQQISARTGIEKIHYNEQSKDVKQVHNKAFSVAKISQYKSAQKG